MRIDLERMTDREFEDYLEELAVSYADELSAAVGYSREEAERLGREHMARFRPGQPNPVPTSPFRLVDEEGTQVGAAWVTAKGEDAFLTDFRIRPEFRGKGCGKAALARVEEHLRGQGCTRLRLHVFAMNEAARALYEENGFEVVSLQMGKRLVD